MNHSLSRQKSNIRRQQKSYCSTNQALFIVWIAENSLVTSFSVLVGSTRHSPLPTAFLRPFLGGAKRKCIFPGSWATRKTPTTFFFHGKDRVARQICPRPFSLLVPSPLGNICRYTCRSIITLEHLSRAQEEECMTISVLPVSFAARPATEGDQQAIAELLIAIEHDLYGNIESTIASQVEWVNNTWQTPGFELEADSQVVIAPDHRIVGYVTVWREPEAPRTMIASPRIHPACYGLGLGTYLNRWAQQRARQITEIPPSGERVVLNSWAAERNQTAQQILRHEGFAPERYFWQMEIELDGPPPNPCGLRA